MSSLFDLYQDRGFLEAYARYYGLEVIDSDGLLVCRRRRLGLGTVHSFTGGPEVFGRFDAWMPRARAAGGLYLRVFTNQTYPALARYRVSEHDTCNFYIDVSRGEEAVWKRMNKTSREVIRKSIRNGGVVRLTYDLADVDRFVALLHKTSRSGTKYGIPERSYFEHFLASGYGVLSVLERDGVLAGGVFWIRCRHLHAMYSGNDRDQLEGVQSNLLFWEVARWAAEQRLSGLELGMQSVGQLPTLARFKRAIGCDEIPAADYRVPLSAAKAAVLGVLRFAGKRLQ